ncbi:MAG: transcriptional repressor LexA [Rhodothermales bacterium]
MSRKHLTAKQHSFLKFLKNYVREHGVWPTYREMVDQFDYRSPNSVTQNLQALYKKGFLMKEDEGYQFVSETANLLSGPLLGIPILGTITAGVLQEAIEDNQGTITLETLFPNLDRIFAIRVSGQSMIGVDIQDGDYVLLIDDDIPNGGIGAVLYDGETSLKRIYQEQDGLRLVAANDAYKDIRISPDIFEEVKILGRYVGHVNKNGIYKRSFTGRSQAA